MYDIPVQKLKAYITSHKPQFEDLFPRLIAALIQLHPSLFIAEHLLQQQIDDEIPHSWSVFSSLLFFSFSFKLSHRLLLGSSHVFVSVSQSLSLVKREKVIQDLESFASQPLLTHLGSLLLLSLNRPFSLFLIDQTALLRLQRVSGEDCVVFSEKIVEIVAHVLDHSLFDFFNPLQRKIDKRC